jgi:hypothetical protein
MDILNAFEIEFLKGRSKILGREFFEYGINLMSTYTFVNIYKFTMEPSIGPLGKRKSVVIKFNVIYKEAE